MARVGVREAGGELPVDRVRIDVPVPADDGLHSRVVETLVPSPGFPTNRRLIGHYSVRRLDLPAGSCITASPIDKENSKFGALPT